MSSTLERQINDFASALLEDVPVTTAQSVRAMPVTTSEESTPAGLRVRLSGPMLAAVTFVAVVVIVVAATVVFRSQPFSPATNPVTTTVQQVTPTTAALVVPELSTTTRASDPAEFNWVRAEIPTEAVVAVSAGDRIYAVSQGLQSIASTTNGSDWTSHDTGGPLQDFSTVAAWQDWIVIVGGGGGISTEEDGPITWFPFNVAIWNDARQEMKRRSFPSVDGSIAAGVGGQGVFVATWTEFHPDDFVGETFGRDDFVEIKIEGDDLIVIWADGSTDRVAAAGPLASSTETRSSGWLTKDGSTWTHVPDLPARFDFIVGFDDGFLALGASAAFFSSDGLTWQRVDGAAQGAWSEPTAMGNGVAFATESTIVTINRSGTTSQPSPVQRPYSGFDRPIVTSGASTIAMFDLAERTYNYQRAGTDWITADLPELFPEADLGGWFTHTGAVTDELMIIGVYEIGAESFTDIDWWVATQSRVEE